MKTPNAKQEIASIPMDKLQALIDAALDAGHLLFLGDKDVRSMRDESATKINIAVSEIMALPRHIVISDAT